VENRIDLVLAQSALDSVPVADVAANDLHPLDRAAAHELALRNPIPHETHHIGLAAQQPL